MEKTGLSAVLRRQRQSPSCLVCLSALARKVIQGWKAFTAPKLLLWLTQPSLLWCICRRKGFTLYITHFTEKKKYTACSCILQGIWKHCISTLTARLNNTGKVGAGPRPWVYIRCSQHLLCGYPLLQENHFRMLWSPYESKSIMPGSFLLQII